MGRQLLLLCILFLMVGHSQAQQPWVRSKGEAYGQVGINTLFWNRVYVSPTTAGVPQRNLYEVMLSGYVELGIVKNLMFSAQIPLTLIGSGEVNPDYIGLTLPKGTLVGFGNVNSTLTYQLFKKGGFVFSTALSAYFDTALRDDDLGLQTGYQANGFEPKLLAGWGLKKHFFALGAGVNFRTNGYSHQLRIETKWGAKIGKKKRGWYILAVNPLVPINKKTAIENANLNGTPAINFLHANEQGWIGISNTFGFDKDPLSIWFTMGGGPGWLVARAPVFTFSIGRKIQLWNRLQKDANQQATD